MLLGPVSLLDCVVFLAFLAPQLILHVGLFRTTFIALQALPFLLLRMPAELIAERYYTSPKSQSAFVKKHSLFEDLVIRCVRYAFGSIPADVGRVFFSKGVALPFYRWRMLRHGYWRCPVHWRECTIGEGRDKSRGVWIMHEPQQQPDIAIYYVHGGGFAMGSCYFYFEFLTTWHHLLVEAGYKNPAIFALDYALVPDEVYPKQVNETMEGYKHVLSVARDASRVCVAGDSAGGTLVLSMLLELGKQKHRESEKSGLVRFDGPNGMSSGGLTLVDIPRMAALISPWATLQTDIHYPSHIDYLDRSTLWEYAHEYAGDDMLHAPPASPGVCEDNELWRAASPQRGYMVTYGDEEVFAPDIERFVSRQKDAGVEMRALRFEHEAHAWPVASLFLSDTEQKRLKGLRSMVAEIRRRSVGIAVK